MAKFQVGMRVSLKVWSGRGYITGTVREVEDIDPNRFFDRSGIETSEQVYYVELEHAVCAAYLLESEMEEAT